MYPDVREAWRHSFQDERVPYVNAIIKEATIYYTVSAMSLPRKTVTDVQWGSAKIPARAMVLINAQAANHGKTIGHFSAPQSRLMPEVDVDHLSAALHCSHSNKL
jgi:phenylacetate 2-hydroxylase